MKSCVNEEIILFNSKLKKLSEQTVNLRVIDVTTNREMFTKHGLHMNRRGKEQTAEKIATEVSTLLQGNKSKPIVLQWKEEEAKKRSIRDVVEVTSASDSEVDKLEPPGNSNSTSSDLGMLCSPDKSDEMLETKDIEEHTTGDVRTSARHKQLPTTNYSEAQEDVQTAPRTSYRLKKTPVTMNEDFFWTTGFRNREH
jgi:predicted lactoylglutathione lyase